MSHEKSRSEAKDRSTQMHKSEPVIESLKLLESLGQRETIEFVCRRLMELQPAKVLALLNYARALGNLGRIDQMRHYLAKALELEPENPWARLLLGQTQILDGNYLEGFLNLEARWGTYTHNYMIAELPIPWWRGESLKGKRLLLFSEMSLGIRGFDPICSIFAATLRASRQRGRVSLLGLQS